jgi:CheY-like chemotaxis protein
MRNQQGKWAAFAAQTESRSASVLVVDDEPDVTWVIRFNLEVEGYRTFVASDGQAALRAIDQHCPQVMVLDVMMPVMDGWSVLEKLRRVPLENRPRIVVVSARTSPEDRARATELGVDAFVPKPFDVEDLVELIRGLTPQEA